ncbi:Protein transport protein SEC24 [Entamoeba marina]
MTSPFISFTSTAVPSSTTVVAETSFPLSLQLTPFAEENVDSITVDSVVEMPRCAYCRAFMSKKMKWTRIGAKYICGYCGRQNEKYMLRYKYLERDGANGFPELVEDVYEFEYQQPIPHSTLNVIMIDTSSFFVQSNDYRYCIHAIRSYVKQHLSQNNFFCFILYNSMIAIQQFGGHYSTSIFPIVEDKMVDLVGKNHQKFFASANNSQQLEDFFTALLDIPKMVEFAPTPSKGSCFGSALQLATDILKGKNGTILSICGSQCTFGVGITTRTTEDIYNSLTEHDLLIPDSYNELYQQIALDCITSSIIVNMIFFENGYLDVATLAEPVHVTNGTLHVYKPNFATLQELVVDIVGTKPVATTCSMRLRTPSCFDVESVNGHCFQKTIVNYACSGLRKDSTLLFSLSLNKSNKLQTSNFQFALSYIATNGAKRTRVFNISLDVSNDIQQIISTHNLKQTMKAFTSNIIFNSKEKPILKTITEASKSFKIIKKYLPSNSVLPIYYYGLTQHPAFTTKPVPTDIRYSYISQLETYSNEMLNWFVPLLYQINSTDNITQIQLSSNLIEHGLYVLINDKIVVIVSPTIRIELLKEYLNVSSLEDVENIVDWSQLPIKPVLDSVRQICKNSAIVTTISRGAPAPRGASLLMGAIALRATPRRDQGVDMDGTSKKLVLI